MRLDDINNWLPYFPVETNTIVGEQEDFASPLDDDEIMDLLHFAQPVEGNIRNLQQGNNGFFDNLQAMKEAYAMYQEADNLTEAVAKALAKPGKEDDGKQRHKSNKRRRGKRNGKKDDESTESSKNPKKKPAKKVSFNGGEKCPHCGKVHKKPWKDCWSLPANKDKKPEWFNTNGKSKQQTSNAIQECQVLIKTSMLQKLVQKAAKPRRKRAVIG